MIITTNIRLPEEQWKALKIMAIHAGTSVSALLRHAVSQILQDQPSAKERESGKKAKRKTLLTKNSDPFFDIIGIGSGGPADGSVNHDHYLYGWPKKS